MWVGVVGNNLREDRAFRVKVCQGVKGLPDEITNFYGTLNDLRQINDPSDRHYTVSRTGKTYTIAREKKPGVYEKVASGVESVAA